MHTVVQMRRSATKKCFTDCVHAHTVAGSFQVRGAAVGGEGIYRLGEHIRKMAGWEQNCSKNQAAGKVTQQVCDTQDARVGAVRQLLVTSIGTNKPHHLVALQTNNPNSGGS